MWKKHYPPIVDLKNDYLRVYPDSSPAQQVVVFRSRHQDDVVAVSLPDWKSDYNAFRLYQLRSGKLRDVTRQLLSMPARINEYLYELPRFGTTIRVYRFDLNREERWHVFDLKWRGGRFVRAS